MASEDSEIARLRAEIEELETKLRLFRRREQLDLEYHDLIQQDACETVIQAVCAEFGIPKNVLLSPVLRGGVVRPRQLAMMLSYELTELSSTDVGRIFRKDHSTVLYSVRAIRNRTNTDRKFAARVQRVRQALEHGHSCPQGAAQ